MHTYLKCVKRITKESFIFVVVADSAQDLWKSLLPKLTSAEVSDACGPLYIGGFSLT